MTYRSILFLAIPLLVSCPSWAELTLRVIDDRKEPVPCQVYLEGAEGRRVHVGKTDAKGVARLTNTCHSAQKVVLAPADDNHLFAEKKCSSLEAVSENIILVTRIEFLDNLVANAAWLESREQYADAALVYNEIYQRARLARPSLAKIARSKLYDAFAAKIEHIGPTLEFDDTQGAFVMTTDFELSIYAYQKENALEETGVIDFPTLTVGSHRKVFDYLTKRWDVSGPLNKNTDEEL